MKPFKLIVAGGRDFNDKELFLKTMQQVEQELAEYSVALVSGMAKGADLMGYQFAKEQGITCHHFPADWSKHGKRAGYIRNQEMADFSDGLVAFWDGQSRGTKHMIETMKAQKKLVTVVYYNMPKITWAKRGGYECSSKGDKRFSALYAYMPDGRTLEQHYQCDVKGYDVGGFDWKKGKGKHPMNPEVNLWEEYLKLWQIWGENNKELLLELRLKAQEHGNCLSDMFATTPVNQAHALAALLNGETE